MTSLLALALLLPVLLISTQKAEAAFVWFWYFGTDSSGNANDPTRVTDELGTTLACGDAVQVLWVGPDGLIDPVNPATCLPTGDDQLITNTGGNTLSTFDPGFGASVCDGVFFLVPDKTGRITRSENVDRGIWDDIDVYCRAYNASTCAGATFYGNSAIRHMFGVEEPPGSGDFVDRDNFGPFQTLLPMGGPTDTATPTATNTAVPTDTPTQVPTDTPTDTPTATSTTIGTLPPTPTFTATATQVPTGVATPFITNVDMPNKSKAGVRDTDVQITWTTTGGVTYQIEFSDVWPPVWGPLAGGLAGPTYTDNLGAVGGPITERYYRISEEVTGGMAPNTAAVFRIDACGAGSSVLAGIPLDMYDSSIQDVISFQLVGGTGPATADAIDLWNGSTYDNNLLIDTGGAWPSYDGQWYDPAAGAISADSMALGDGFWITSAVGAGEVVYIEGLVPDTSFNCSVPGTGQIMLAHPYPESMAMNSGAADNLNYLASGGTQGANENIADTIHLWDCGGGYRIQFLAPDGQWWSGGAPTGETLDAGEGFWLKRGTAAGGGVNWTLPKPYVNPPN